MLLLVFGLLGLVTAPEANPLIAPGRSLGNVSVGAPPDVLTALGPPDFSDAAMQKAWATWFSTTPAQGARPHQLDVFTAGIGPDLHKEIKVVRATSPFFHTVGGIGVSSTLAEIRRSCGPFVLTDTFTVSRATGRRYLYDNARAGIAFELDGQSSASHCTAVLIHEPGKAMQTNYRSLVPYLKQLAQQAEARP